jgi:hypothetical protein
MNQTTYLNENGLENGKIPANKECPFFDNCKGMNENCPSEKNKNIRNHTFSCAFARGYSLIKSSKEENNK